MLESLLHFSIKNRWLIVVLTAVVAEEGDPDLDFVGHVGGDDFVVVTTPERAEAISQRIVERFDAEIDRYYSPEDRKRRGINARDRQGNELFVPLIGITLAVVCVQNGGYDHPAQISQTAAEGKSYLKLRELTLSYTLPKAHLGRFKSVTVGLFGKNLKFCLPSENVFEKRDPTSVVDSRVCCGMMRPALLLRMSSMFVVWFR